MERVIIVQGGGFRTSFTTGILDAFIAMNYRPFDTYIGVSGGAIAISYFLGKQYQDCFSAMKFLAMDAEFVQLKRVMSLEGYMNIDQLRTVAREHVPFNQAAAEAAITDKKLYFIATNKTNGKPEYLIPEQHDWIDTVIASCTLPFVTKGSHEVKGLDLMDGGWGDPLPVKWAIEQGAKEILLLRTIPKDLKLAQSWPDYFGSLYYRSNPELSECFANSHELYNDSIDYINQVSKNFPIRQLAPAMPLKCGTYSYSIDSITQDYRYGLACGINYVHELLNKK